VASSNSKPKSKPKSKARPLLGLSSSDRVLLSWLVPALMLLAGMMGAMGATWAVGATGTVSNQHQPAWLTTGSVRAMSSDGAVIKARLALDAPDADTREWIRSRPGQMALLLQISMADYDSDQAEGGQRVQHLAAEIRVHLNKFLTENGIAPVRQVVVQDLVFSKT
jgi:hypothetical protein